MDTVHEENRQRELRKLVWHQQNDDISENDEQENHCSTIGKGEVARKNLSPPDRDFCSLHPPQITITDADAQLSGNCDCNGGGESSALSSRRPSAIIAALRRPSQAVALSAAHAVMNQRRYLLGLYDDDSSSNRRREDNRFLEGRRKFRLGGTMDRSGITIVLSALYAKLLVVLGMAFPITEVLSKEVREFYYQGFYLYLYVGSIAFILYEYVTFVKERAVKDIIRNYHDPERADHSAKMPPTKPAKKYGSFFLRLGAIAFGIGSMVYSGLEFGRYFEMKSVPNCSYGGLQAVTPATRMLLTLLQVQFIFLNHKDVELNRHAIIGRFGLMHMIATNLCEWLCVLVEETQHEMIQLSAATTKNQTDEKYCPEGRLMGSLVTNASPFLFPCTIEYSLICAVILFEMWKNIGPESDAAEKERKKPKSRTDDFATTTNSAHHHFTIDCSNSHKGLFAGIVVIVLTIISLVMFFVLTAKERENGVPNNQAQMEVNVVELVLYTTTTVAVVVAMFQMRNLRYDRRIDQGGLGLDNMLLAVAQTGMFIYSMFSIIGWYFTMEDDISVGLVADIFSFIQTCLQTMFICDAWWRRCKSLSQAKSKPGRELIIFLMIANMAMWSINTLEKNRAEFRPTHLKFFGEWAWTIITHISMPLAIFYRFHSTICLFEVWKIAYKIKSNFKNPLFPVL